MVFTEVDNELTSELTGLRTSDHICSKSVTTYIHALIPLEDARHFRYGLPLCLTGGKMGRLITLRFLLYSCKVKDVWSAVGISPPLDKQTFSVYGKSLNDVVALIYDNCSTNKATANLLSINLLGCSCHKLNLAIGRLIESQPELAKAFDSLKSKHLKVGSGARGIDLTCGCPSQRHTVAFKLRDGKKVFEIEMELRQLPELEMPRQSDFRSLRVFTPTLAKFASVMIGLQNHGLSIASARGTLIEILEDFPELRHYLAQDAGIVHNPAFESALGKVLDGRIGEMSPREQAKVRQFERPNQPPARQIEWGSDHDYYTHIEDRKRRRLEEKTSYEDLRYMLGTSASVKRGFSMAKGTMTDKRNRISPIMFEALMFLKPNTEFWDSRLFEKAVKDVHA
ncbi:hypothetical protein PHMEG_0001960 [Phytophthora megakarya]|uniref:HAT C-terminal dimerisation domain-containing protein n=1 Tax=Phytophthora megakarya TaxID=4795 RepID=A0A225X1H8_9STRA|nr:hypothetical protein PHMEG_0001960 [Phytophthora megakarya]